MPAYSYINRLRFSALQIAAARFSGSCQSSSVRDAPTHIAVSPVTPGHTERFGPAYRRGRQFFTTHGTDATRGRIRQPLRPTAPFFEPIAA